MAADGTLTGTVTGKRGTSSIINGYLSVNKFSFTINIPIEGSPSDVNFTGTFAQSRRFTGVSSPRCLRRRRNKVTPFTGRILLRYGQNVI